MFFKLKKITKLEIEGGDADRSRRRGGGLVQAAVGQAGRERQSERWPVRQIEREIEGDVPGRAGSGGAERDGGGDWLRERDRERR